MTLDKAKELVEYHMKRVGLKDYSFQWMQKRTKFNRIGNCNYKKRIISLQPNYVELNPEDKVLDTILHEIAHALTPKHGHNKFWKRKAIEIGCNGQRCYKKGEIIKQYE